MHVNQKKKKCSIGGVWNMWFWPLRKVSSNSFGHYSYFIDIHIEIGRETFIFIFKMPKMIFVIKMLIRLNKRKFKFKFITTIFIHIRNILCWYIVCYIVVSSINLYMIWRRDIFKFILYFILVYLHRVGFNGQFFYFIYKKERLSCPFGTQFWYN